MVFHHVRTHEQTRFSLRNLSARIDSIIAWRFIPNRVVTRPVGAIWIPLVQEPWYKLPYRLRLTLGWLALLGIVFGSAFGFKPTGV